jgi:4-amino-4-deoxy-L-arabinose transferase-like glycosyltransferase
LDDPFPRLSRLDALAAALITAVTLAALAPHLAHPAIFSWDESLHQAVARGTYDDFLFPHIYGDPLHEVKPQNFWEAQVYLNKPPAPFWLAAIFMHAGLGITPLALRLVSLLGQLIGALALYLWLRGLAGRFWAITVAVSFNLLPFTWRLTQGVQFGDATDCGLMACLAVSFLALQLGVAQRSLAWSALAGAATGAAILFKAPLGLPLIGVGAVLMVFKMLRPRDYAAFLVTAVAVALPWNWYAAGRWPDAYAVSFGVWVGHMHDASSSVTNIGFRLPVDALFNTIMPAELFPLPPILPVLGGIWLCIRAVRRREPLVVALAVWVVACWIFLSMADTKVPAGMWGAMPALLSGLALLGREATQSLMAALALAGALATRLITRIPWVLFVHFALPHALPQTRSLPGIVEGLIGIGIGLALARPLAKALRGREPLEIALRVTVTIVFILALLAGTSRAQSEAREERLNELASSYSREVGLALDAAVPKRAVIDIATDSDEPGCCFEKQSLMFWSGRMAYRPLDQTVAAQRGYHRYRVSPVSEPFAAVPGVPLDAWWRAYDLETPAEEAALPDGLERVDADVGAMHIYGFAAGPIDGRRDRWAVFVSSPAPEPLTLGFELHDGSQAVRVEPQATLKHNEGLAGRKWFILPVVGPRRSDVTRVTFTQ